MFIAPFKRKVITICMYRNDSSTVTGTRLLKLLPHSLGVTHRGSSLFCYSVTYLEYKTACRIVYVIPLSHIIDIRELAMKFLLFDRELYFISYS